MTALALFSDGRRETKHPAYRALEEEGVKNPSIDTEIMRPPIIHLSLLSI